MQLEIFDEVGEAHPQGTWGEGGWSARALRRISGLIPEIANRPGTSRASRRRPAAYLYARDQVLLPGEAQAVLDAARAMDPNTVLFRGEAASPHAWTRANGESQGVEGRARFRDRRAPSWARWMVEPRSTMGSTTIAGDVVEHVARELGDALVVLANWILPDCPTRAGIGRWKSSRLDLNLVLELGRLSIQGRATDRIVAGLCGAPRRGAIYAPTLELLLLAVVLAFGSEQDREATLLALELAESVQEPLGDGWMVAVDHEQARGALGAERLAVLALRACDPWWWAIGWAGRMLAARAGRPCDAGLEEIAVAWGIVAIDGRITSQPARAAGADVFRTSSSSSGLRGQGELEAEIERDMIEHDRRTIEAERLLRRAMAAASGHRDLDLNIYRGW